MTPQNKPVIPAKTHPELFPFLYEAWFHLKGGVLEGGVAQSFAEPPLDVALTLAVLRLHGDAGGTVLLSLLLPSQVAIAVLIKSLRRAKNGTSIGKSNKVQAVEWTRLRYRCWPGKTKNNGAINPTARLDKGLPLHGRRGES